MRHTFDNIEALHRAVLGGLDIYNLEGAFVNLDEWKQRPAQAQLVFFDEDHFYVDDDEEPIEEVDGIPQPVHDEGLRFLLLSPLLIDVFEVAKNQQKRTELIDLVRMINHYRTFDSFEP